ncbi:MAG TPA: 2-C-methyl-D-erythritol 4-phosphate cytidylyltransferase [Halothiobacillaceae bacterium]|nr:2-C-methyl-D-erythritol 4-phosphate cytidylyltransferase [Halothiobacillaceae bacterium]
MLGEAAGSGQRMRGGLPKQYLPLGSRSVIEVALSRFIEIPGLAGVILVTSGAIPESVDLALSSLPVPVHRVEGGATRAESVRNGLTMFRESWAALAPSAADGGAVGDEAWVMVHDAARPCVRPADVERLLRQVNASDGGLLGTPVRDTIKRVEPGGEVIATVDRAPLMHALTPQLFRAGLLRKAIDAALAAGLEITDEASAMEYAGRRPRIVAGSADNLKITHPEDLAIARAILRHQGVLHD